MVKLNELKNKIIILIFAFVLLMAIGCNSEEDKSNINDNIANLFDDDLIDIPDDSDQNQDNAQNSIPSRTYKTLKDAKVYPEANEKVLFGTYRIERKFSDAWSYIQKNLHYQDGLSVEPIEIQFGYKDLADFDNEASFSDNILSCHHISDSDLKDKDAYYLEKLDEEKKVSYIENLHKLYNYKMMCVLYAAEGKEFSQSKKKLVTSGTYIYYIYELDGDNILYAPFEVNADTLEVKLPPKKEWKKMKYGFAGNSLIVDTDGYEVDLASYGALSRDNGSFDLRGFLDDPEGYNDVVSIRLSESDKGVKQCFITFKDGSSTWELNGATFDITGENDIAITWPGNEHPAKSSVYKMSEKPGEIKGKLLYACSPYTGDNYFSIVTDSGICYFLNENFDHFEKTESDNLQSGTDINDLPDDKLAAMEETKQKIIDQLTEGFEENDVEVEVNEETGKTVLDDSILFSYNSSKLTKDGKAYLDKFLKVYADVVTAEDFNGKISSVRIEGHTDISGDYDYNLKLSKKRAESVADYCKKAYPELAPFIETEGKSYSEPIYNDDGSVNMAASRRVEFKIILNS